MEILLLLVCCILLMQLLFVVWNLQQLPKLKKGFPVPSDLSISILIPARNEAKRIGDCLESLVKQSTQPLEILVLDDNSSDETEFVVRKWSKKYPHIRLIKGSHLKEGWVGKSFACHQLALVAKGDWFLFLDADVRLMEEAMEIVYESANLQETGMISGFPRQQAFSWLEKLVVPMMMFTVACHLPIKWVRKTQDPKFTAAHGGFILIERNCYKSIGGHRTIRHHLVDDLELAKSVKRNGFPFTLAAITNIAYMRMYENASEVWEGYRKNIFPGVNKNLWVLLSMIIFYFSLYLFPFCTMLLKWNDLNVSFLAFVAFLLGVCIKGWIDYTNGQPWWSGLFVPISVLMVILIGLDSLRMDWTKKGYVWKGRRYT